MGGTLAPDEEVLLIKTCLSEFLLVLLDRLNLMPKRERNAKLEEEEGAAE